MPDGLAAFLTARLDEAEAAAKAVEDNSAPWTGEWEADGNYALRTHNGWVLATARHPDTGFRPGVLAHIAANDPARTLRGIAAKRAILAAHKTTITKRETYPFSPATGGPIPAEHDSDCEVCGWFYPEQGGCLTMRHLAAEWDDHPAYLPEWSPEPATAP